MHQTKVTLFVTYQGMWLLGTSRPSHVKQLGRPDTKNKLTQNDETGA